MSPDSIENSLISVILPVLNGGSLLSIAVKSIIDQTYQNWELIIVDDGSTDGAIDNIKEMDEPRIRILSDGVNKGLATRLNEAVNIARGTYIARMDADDISFPLRFSKQIHYLEAHPEVDLVGCRAVAFKNIGDIIGLLPFAADHKALCSKPWRNIPLPHPAWMGRRKWFQSYPYRLPEVIRAEDQELLLRAAPFSKFACLNEILLAYRQGPFNFRRTLIARKALLAAQLDLFISRGEWLNAGLASSISALKITIDLIAIMPGCEFIFFRRMSEPVPSSVKEILQQYFIHPDS